jgi:hypothetical protein
MCLRSPFGASIAEFVHEIIREPKHVLPPAGLLVRVAHANQGT